jgi:hypothetical membrane protein
VTTTPLRSLLLRAGAGAPILAAGCILLAWAAYPGFDNATQYLSELGGAKAPNPIFFDLSLVTAALGGSAAGLGFALAVPALGGGRFAGWLVGACFVAAAVGLVCGIAFVYPNPWHNLIQLGLGIQIAPFALLWALWRADGMNHLRRFLVIALAAMIALTLVTKHVVWPDLVNAYNVGWWERGYAVVLVGWGGIAAIMIERRLQALAGGETAAGG